MWEYKCVWLYVWVFEWMWVCECVRCVHIWVMCECMSDCGCVSECMSMCVPVCVQVCVSQRGCVDECEGACFMVEMGEFIGTCLPVRARYTYPGALEQSCGCCKQVLGLSYRFCPSPLPATSKSKPLLPGFLHVTICLTGLSVSLLSPAVIKHSDPK